MPGGRETAVCVIAEGTTIAGRFERLDDHFDAVTIVEVTDGATSDAARLNPIVDGASANWILLVRAGESVGDDAAAEIARNATSEPRAWAYRIAVRPTYCGKTLELGRREPGDVRLFHRRKSRLRSDGTMKVHGTVVRFTSALHFVLFESQEAHVESLNRSGRARAGLVRHLTNFAGIVSREGVRSLRAPTRNYLWLESGWDEA